MTVEDAAYAKTRRRGTTGTVTRVTGITTNADSGARVPTTVETTVRWMVKEPTQYSRLLRAEAVQQRIGLTSFTMWFPDVSAAFTELSTEDWITFGGKKYEVMTSTLEDTSFIVTANEIAK